MKPEKAKKIISSSREEADTFSRFVRSNVGPNNDLKEVCYFLSSPLDTEIPSSKWLKRTQGKLRR